MSVSKFLLLTAAALLLLTGCGQNPDPPPAEAVSAVTEPAVPGETAPENPSAENPSPEPDPRAQETEDTPMQPSPRFPYDIPDPGERNSNRLGLHVEDGGEIRLAGERFCGFGVNYFGAFAHYWYADFDDQPFTEAFRKLKDYGVDFVRMPFGGYWTDYYEAFDRDPDEVLRYLDRVVEAAEETKIGIIVSLFWHDTALPLHVDEHRSAMGDPESATVRYALDYTAVIVSRYAASPAVWAWEIGNEYNLDADLCDTVNWSWLSGYPGDEPAGFDYFSSEEMIFFYRQISGKIREYDGWRMIETGNGEMRPFAKASSRASQHMNKKTHSWTVDWTKNTRAQFDEMNALMTPDPIDCTCFHLQQGSGDGSGQYMETMDPWGETVTQREYFTAYKKAADAVRKGCIFGEMGDFLDMNSAPDLEEHFRALIDDIRASGIQLALTWQFQDFTDAGSDGMKLTVLGEANRRYRSEGLYPVDKAWE